MRFFFLESAFTVVGGVSFLVGDEASLALIGEEDSLSRLCMAARLRFLFFGLKTVGCKSRFSLTPTAVVSYNYLFLLAAYFFRSPIDSIRPSLSVEVGAPFTDFLLPPCLDLLDESSIPCIRESWDG